MDSTTKQGSHQLPETNIKELLALLQGQDSHVELCVRPKTSKGSQQSYRAVMDGSQLVQWYLANIAYENSESGIILVDSEYQVLMVNHAFTEITGYFRDEIVGQTISTLGLVEGDAVFSQHYEELLATRKPYSGKIYSRKKNGDVYKQKLTIQPYKNEQGEYQFSVLTLSNMSEVLEQLVHFKHLSEVDTLTKLPNRTLLQREFQSALAVAKRNNKRLGLLYIDLNDFKPINDDFGHHCGDEVLKVIANRMWSCIRETDTLARIGGDEFVLLVSNIDMEVRGVCASMTEKLKRLISVPIACGSKTLRISASIGSAKYPDHGSSLEELLHQADISMYENKRESKQA